MKVPVSLLVPIRNEAFNLARCLDSVSWADEIVVVDSASTDGSQAIAEAHGARILNSQEPTRNENVAVVSAQQRVQHRSVTLNWNSCRLL